MRALLPGDQPARFSGIQINHWQRGADCDPALRLTWPMVEVKVRYNGVEPLKPVSK